MSNILDKNPMVIDTAGSTVLVTSKIYPQSIRLVVLASATIGESTVVTDKNDNVVWATTAPAAQFAEAEQLDSHKPWEGLKVPTLPHGKLYITLKHAPLS